MASLNPKTGALNHRLAAHLLRRTTYVPTRQNVDTFAIKTADEAVDDLFVLTDPTMDEPIDYITGEPWINSGSPPQLAQFHLKNIVRSWWINEARQDLSIGHKMMFFLHTCFTTASDILNSSYNFDHLQLLRFYAIGSYRDFAKKMTLDNQMLQYLNNTLNNVGLPNENYAREFLELFTIGKGEQIGPGDYTNYTEDDIAAAARVLTGFKRSTRGDYIDTDTSIPTGRAVFSQHDTLSKTFSSAFQNTTLLGAQNEAEMFDELSAFIDLVFAQEETARFICRKIYRFFVSKNITDEIEQDIIEPLATTFQDNDYNLELVMKQLLKSEHFFDEDDANAGDEIIGSLIKSPLDNVLMSLNVLDIAIPDPLTDSENHYSNFYRRGVMDTMFSLAGFDIFRPDVVAGYPAYYQQPDFNRTWFSSNTIIPRYKLPQMLIEGSRVLLSGTLGGVQFDVVAFTENPNNVTDPFNASGLVQDFLNYMLPEFPDTERYDYFLNDVFLNGLFIEDWLYEWENYLDTGDDSEVRIPLENLVTAIMYSQEYQLF